MMSSRAGRALIRQRLDGSSDALGRLGVHVDESHRESTGALIQGFRVQGDRLLTRQVDPEQQPDPIALRIHRVDETAAEAEIVDANGYVEQIDAPSVKRTVDALMPAS
jgi:hypothetical protein